LIPHSVSTTLIPYLYGDKGKYFEVFAVGMFICMIYTYTQNSSQAERWNNRMRRLSLQMFIAGLILLFFMSIIHFYYTDISTNYTEYHIIVKTSFDPYAYSIIVNWLEWQATAYAIAYGLCFWALLYGSPRLKRPFEWSVLSHIASISFSLYMWHFLLMYLFAYALDNNIRRQGWGSLVQYGIFWCWTFVVIFPVATMLYRWIEQPGMRLGERLICKLVR
jgi:peptidoglycan/LPS O-acetylase OafA/YrhL